MRRRTLLLLCLFLLYCILCFINVSTLFWLHQSKQLRQEEEELQVFTEPFDSRDRLPKLEHPHLRHPPKQLLLPPSSNTIQVSPIGKRHPIALPIHFPTKDQFNPHQELVRKAMTWAWSAYEKHAFGADVLNVRSMQGQSWNNYNLGLTLIDSLDTLLIMDMQSEYHRALEWIEAEMSLKLEQAIKVNLFETTIRILGGFLSAYHFTGNKKLLELAINLADRLLCAFTSSSPIPLSDVNLGRRTASSPIWGDSSLSEVTTIQLEFKYLSQLTGNPIYQQKVDVVMDYIDERVQKEYPDGLLPIFVNAASGRFSGSTITLGARGDSYYEYLLKQYLISNCTEIKYRRRYERAIDSIKKKLVRTSQPNHYVFIGELINGHFSPKMDHLVCFLPGLLALGYVNGMDKSHMELAEGLLHTCYQMYNSMGSKLAPEIAHFNLEKDVGEKDIVVSPSDDFNILRPETVESLMILYHITKNQTYRNWGLEIFRAFETHAKLPEGGYASTKGVSSSKPTRPFR